MKNENRKTENDVKIVSKKCVNSNWLAYWLTDSENYCQCGFECKIKVSIKRNGHQFYDYILDRNEYLSICNDLKIQPDADVAHPEPLPLHTGSVDALDIANELFRSLNRITNKNPEVIIQADRDRLERAMAYFFENNQTKPSERLTASQQNNELLDKAMEAIAWYKENFKPLIRASVQDEFEDLLSQYEQR